MKINKVLNDKIVIEAARNSEIDIDVAKKFIKEYYNLIKNELTNGNEVITPLGRMYITVRKLNQTFCDKESTHKITLKINKDYKKFLDSRS